MCRRASDLRTLIQVLLRVWIALPSSGITTTTILAAQAAMNTGNCRKNHTAITTATRRQERRHKVGAGGVMDNLVQQQWNERSYKLLNNQPSSICWFHGKVTATATLIAQINDKNCSLSIVLTAMDQKLQKS